MPAGTVRVMFLLIYKQNMTSDYLQTQESGRVYRLVTDSAVRGDLRKHSKSLKRLVTPTGFEPVTVGLEIRLIGNFNLHLSACLLKVNPWNHKTYSDLLLHVKTHVSAS